MRGIAVLAVAALAGCAASSDDPSEGGFFNGVRGIATGGYDARIAEREQSVATAQARNQALEEERGDLASQIAATRQALAQARLTLLQQRDANPDLDPGLRSRVDAVLRAEPSNATETEQLSDLQRILAETRALSLDLSRLAG